MDDKKEYQELNKYYQEYYRKEEKQKAKKYRKYKKRISNLKAIINSIGNARENSIVTSIK